MRNNNTERRSAARGAARKNVSGGRSAAGSVKRTARGTSQERPSGKRRYSAGEGSVGDSAADSSAKRTYSRTSAKPERPFRKFAGRDERPERPARRFAGRDERPERPARRFAGRDERPERSGRSRAQAYTPKPRQPKGTGEEGVRLNKFISNSGICSRREADDYITAGLISVNGVIITELGTKVFQNDVVKFNGERIKGEEKVYLVMNKPKDFITTMSDPHADKTVMNLIEGRCPARVYPVGRLDKATTGVLLFTNDGELADKLMHPSFEKKKIYHVYLDKNFKQPDFLKLLDGIELEDGFIKADGLSYIDEDKTQVGVEIHSGRNRIVRRMFEELGYKIKKLDRVYFAGLTKKNLRRGQWRFLTDQEIAMLKMGSFE